MPLWAPSIVYYYSYLVPKVDEKADMLNFFSGKVLCLEKICFTYKTKHLLIWSSTLMVFGTESALIPVRWSHDRPKFLVERTLYIKK